MSDSRICCVSSRQQCRTVGTVDKQLLLAKGFRRRKGRAASGSFEQSRWDMHAMQPVETTRTGKREVASRSLTRSPVVEENCKAHVAVEQAQYPANKKRRKKGQLEGKALRGGIMSNKKSKRETGKGRR